MVLAWIPRVWVIALVLQVIERSTYSPNPRGCKIREWDQLISQSSLSSNFVKFGHLLKNPGCIVVPEKSSPLSKLWLSLPPKSGSCSCLTCLSSRHRIPSLSVLKLQPPLNHCPSSFIHNQVVARLHDSTLGKLCLVLFCPPPCSGIMRLQHLKLFLQVKNGQILAISYQPD